MEKQNYIFKSLNKKLVLSFILLFGVFFLIQVYYTSKVGTKSAEIEQIRIEKDQLRLENEILSSKIDEAMSISSIEAFAKQAGLVQSVAEELQEPLNSIAAQ